MTGRMFPDVDPTTLKVMRKMAKQGEKEADAFLDFVDNFCKFLKAWSDEAIRK